MAGRHQVLHWRHNGRNNVIGQNRISRYPPHPLLLVGDRRTVPAVHVFARASQICSQLQISPTISLLRPCTEFCIWW